MEETSSSPGTGWFLLSVQKVAGCFQFTQRGRESSLCSASVQAVHCAWMKRWMKRWSDYVAFWLPDAFSVSAWKTLVASEFLLMTGVGSNPVQRGLENLSGSHICKVHMSFQSRLTVSWGGLGVLRKTEGGSKDSAICCGIIEGGAQVEFIFKSCTTPSRMSLTSVHY